MNPNFEKISVFTFFVSVAYFFIPSWVFIWSRTPRRDHHKSCSCSTLFPIQQLGQNLLIFMAVNELKIVLKKFLFSSSEIVKLIFFVILEIEIKRRTLPCKCWDFCAILTQVSYCTSKITVIFYDRIDLFY